MNMSFSVDKLAGGLVSFMVLIQDKCFWLADTSNYLCIWFGGVGFDVHTESHWNTVHHEKGIKERGTFVFRRTLGA
jgi:hypothetical protein